MGSIFTCDESEIMFIHKSLWNEHQSPAADHLKGRSSCKTYFATDTKTSTAFPGEYNIFGCVTSVPGQQPEFGINNAM